jgi:hypothetical protein
LASTYTVVTQYETVEFLGGTQTRPVIAVGVQTTAHGVYFEVRIAKSDYSAAVVKNDANGYTIIYELLFTIPGVVDVEWVQEPTSGGQLEDHVVVYFTSTSGFSSASVNIPYSQFNQDYISALVTYRRAELDAVENDTPGPAGPVPTFASTTGPTSTSSTSGVAAPGSRIGP